MSNLICYDGSASTQRALCVAGRGRNAAPDVLLHI
jgi:hypothetical protein